MNKNFRWTEQQLKQHQNMHQNRKNAALAQQKQENDAKVRQAVEQVLNRNTEQNNSNDENKKLAENLMNSLSESQSQTLQKLLSDKEALRKLLSSDQAKNIMKKIGGDKNGHK